MYNINNTINILLIQLTSFYFISIAETSRQNLKPFQTLVRDQDGEEQN